MAFLRKAKVLLRTSSAMQPKVESEQRESLPCVIYGAWPSVGLRCLLGGDNERMQAGERPC